MKNLISIAYASLFLMACTNSSKNDARGSSNYKYLDDTKEARFYDDTAHVNLDTIVGNYTGLNTDTLICEAIDSCTVRIKSLTVNVSPLQFDEVFGVFVVQEGDLDGDGTEEIGVRTEGSEGNWRDYNVYTIKAGAWNYLIPPIILHSSDFYGTLSQGKDVVRPSKRKGYVDIKFNRWQNESICLIDTIMRVNPQPLEKRGEMGFIN